MRRHVRVAMTVAAVLVIGSGATAQQDVRDQLEDTNDQLQDARSVQQRLAEDADVARVILADADQRLYALELQLRDREAELVAAQAELDAANARSGAVNAELLVINGELSEARSELRANEDQFRDRIAAAYKYGGSLPYAQALLNARDFNELATTSYYIRSILRADRRVVEQVSDRTLAVAEARAGVDAVREDLDRERAVIAAAEEEVAARAATHRQVTAMVAEERQAQAALVGQLENDLAAYTTLVADLEAQSQELAAELAALSGGFAPVEGELLWPTDGRAGSGFGPRVHPIFGTTRQHSGVDISGSTGQPIIAAAAGQVVSAGRRGGYGLAVVIDHGGGLATLYAHQSVLNVRDGEFVAQGQKIGEVGSTGFSTGPHLHFEIRVDGVPQDPLRWYR